MEYHSDPRIKEVQLKFKAIRLMRDMNIIDLAKESGVSLHNIYSFEIGRRGMSLRNLIKLAKPLKVNVKEFF